jgi:hypothetical protein
MTIINSNFNSFDTMQNLLHFHSATSFSYALHNPSCLYNYLFKSITNNIIPQINQNRRHSLFGGFILLFILC